ncbi:hypothetical protein shim_10310 [Shimia sp. SK013]|nr:hypothetical protein [Shimia sp. SK013]KPA22743.1 hypothetical protein shim_10310 [Shimia sp. SK013]
MGKLVRALAILLMLGIIGLVAYAYLGPFFGADFSPAQTEISVPVELNGS